jgi:hypothetical protein
MTFLCCSFFKKEVLFIKEEAISWQDRFPSDNFTVSLYEIFISCKAYSSYYSKLNAPSDISSYGAYIMLFLRQCVFLDVLLLFQSLVL